MGWNALRQWIGCRKITQGAAKPFWRSNPNFPACWFQQLVLMIFDVPNWCAKYEYCMATRYLPVGRMVTKAIRPTEGTKIIFVSSCVGLLCHLSWHLPASGNHPSHQRWLWRWWRRGLHQLIDEDPDFFPAGVGENPILVTLPTGSHTMTWLLQLKWRDLRSSLTVPWQLHSIHCSQDERGRPSACEEDNV